MLILLISNNFDGRLSGLSTTPDVSELFFLLVVFVLSNLFAFQQKQKLTHRTGAIITTTAASVKSTPSKNGTDLFILHEGTKVTITDGSMNDWKEIRVADGKEGWIETKEIEII